MDIYNPRSEMITGELEHMEKTGSLLSVMQCSTPPIFIGMEEDENSPEGSLKNIATHPNSPMESAPSITRRSYDTDLAGLPCADSVMFQTLLCQPKASSTLIVPSRPKVISTLQRSFEVRHPIGVRHWNNDSMLRASSSASIRVHFHDSLEEFPVTQQSTCRPSPRISRAPPRFQIPSKNDQNDNENDNKKTAKQQQTTNDSKKGNKKTTKQQQTTNDNKNDSKKSPNTTVTELRIAVNRGRQKHLFIPVCKQSN